MNLFYRGALAALTLTLFLSGCSAPTFNGSRTGNDSQFLMEYTVLNTTDGQTLSLEAGDTLDVAVVSASGAVSVNIQREGAPPLYAREDVPTGQFSLEIPEDGEYNITVTGEQARRAAQCAAPAADNGPFQRAAGGATPYPLWLFGPSPLDKGRRPPLRFSGKSPWFG